MTFSLNRGIVATILAAAVMAGATSAVRAGINPPIVNATVAISSFTPGDLVVLRGGDTSVADTSTGYMPR